MRSEIFTAVENRIVVF